MENTVLMYSARRIAKQHCSITMFAPLTDLRNDIQRSEPQEITGKKMPENKINVEKFKTAFVGNERERNSACCTLVSSESENENVSTCNNYLSPVVKQVHGFHGK